MRKLLVNEVKTFVFFCAALLIFLSLVSYTPEDIPFLNTDYNRPPANFISIVGAYTGFVLFFLFGYASYVIPLILFIKGVAIIFDSFKIPRGLLDSEPVRILFYTFLLICFACILSLSFMPDRTASFGYGGILGFFSARFLFICFGKFGSFVVAVTFLALTIISLFGLPLIVKSVSFIKGVFSRFFAKRRILTKPARQARPQRQPKIEILKVIKKKKEKKPPVVTLSENAQKKEETVRSGLQTATVEGSAEAQAVGEFQLPSLDLLNSPPPLSQRKIKEDITENARILKETLDDFGISVEVVNVDRGPTVTLYELELAAGVKVQKIISLSEDIALALKAPSVRIVAPIPGRGTVGVEVPNTEKHLVFIKELLDTPEFRDSDSPLTLALGKDVSGGSVVADLSKMPHLLVAGTTGSGKTVCLNTIIMSLLYKYSWDKIKFILVDPKMVEMTAFDGIPHLLLPVVSDIIKASRALGWAVEQMEERYRILSREGVRNVEMLNKDGLRLPYIIIVIDELADLMLAANTRDQVETSIQRLAQLARAVGIHLVLATQRPSVDVVTGIIKANFPARISFKVASKVDSRTVLDFTGADKLLGKGDMLFLKPDIGRPIRSQCSYVSDDEIERVTAFLKQQGVPTYDESLSTYIEKPRLHKTDKDPLFDEAVGVILDAGQASVSILQRKLRLSYPRAARLIDSMEDEGIVGPFEGSRPRKILIDKVAWEEIKNNGGQGDI